MQAPAGLPPIRASLPGLSRQKQEDEDGPVRHSHMLGSCIYLLFIHQLTKQNQATLNAYLSVMYVK
jgi:hypothetical protein